MLENTGSVTGYVTKLQVRGKGIYDRAPVVVQVSDAVSLAAFGTRLVRVDMPYQDDENNALGYAEHLLRLYTLDVSQVRQVRCVATASSALLAAALDVDIGSRIALMETVSGVDAECFVQGCAFTQEGDALSVMWTLAPADSARYWLLGIAGASELDLTTVLGYA